MKDRNLSVLLQKASELKALFVLGQSIIPFLEEIFIFVSEIQPLLDEINISIEDNLKRMPKASEQLSKVSKATEVATTEIMDIVDGIIYKTDIIASNSKKIKEFYHSKKNRQFDILESIFEELQKNTDSKAMIAKVTDAMMNCSNEGSKELEEIILHNTEILESIQTDSSSIMMSLQVQDITSQQIAAVNHLLETVQSKLKTILTKFHSSDVGELLKEDFKQQDRTNVTTLHRKIAFDPNAVDSLDDKFSRQNEVDKVIKEQSDKNIIDNVSGEESVVQDDIDALFGSVDVNEQKSEETQVEKEEFSQDDIDALFGK